MYKTFVLLGEMMALKRFEDLEAWQLARELNRRVYKLTRAEPVLRDFSFIDQIRRASISIMNNIAEGFERGSHKDFAKFVFISRGSAGEVRSMLYVALDQNYIDDNEFKDLYSLCIRTSQLCWGLIKYLQKTNKYKTGIIESMPFP